MIVGVLGGGQLGRMLALAGIPLGLRFRFLDPDPACPASHVGPVVRGAYDDVEALARFVEGVSVVTYEFENVPARAAAWLTDHVPVYPSGTALATAQDRIAEKTLFRDLHADGIPVGVPGFRAVDTRDDLRAALRDLGLPAVLKTRRMGYDGKGQAVLRTPGDADQAWAALAPAHAPQADLILEAFVPFRRELSILSARGRDGACVFYPLVQNTHRAGILRESLAPAPEVSAHTQAAAERLAREVLQSLGYVGALAIELFELQDGTLLANEMAPRVHNSGHWTIEGAATSQFENHIRAVCGLPLGDPGPAGHSAMLNLIGDHPPLPDLLALAPGGNGTHVHLYGKSPRAGRKLGHVTLCDHDAHRLYTRLAAARRVIPPL